MATFQCEPSIQESEMGDDLELFVGMPVMLAQGPGDIRFVGATSFAAGEWIGVELREPNGKNDGSVLNVRYFQCPAHYGLFVRRDAVRREGAAPVPASPARKTRTTSKQAPSSSPLTHSRTAGNVKDLSAIEETLERLLQGLGEELRRTGDDVRRHMARLAWEIRVDLADIRKEFRNTKNEHQGVSLMGQEDSLPSGPQTVSFNDETHDEKGALNPVTGELPTEEETSAAVTLQARARGMAERRNQQKRINAAIVLQRYVRRHAPAKQAGSSNALKIIIHAAHHRHKSWVSIFNNFSQGKVGLDEDTFGAALCSVRKCLAKPQCKALFNGVTRHVHVKEIPFKTFAAIAEAVGVSDAAAAEFADLTEEEFVHLAVQSPHAKIGFKKHRSPGGSPVKQ